MNADKRFQKALTNNRLEINVMACPEKRKESHIAKVSV